MLGPAAPTFVARALGLALLGFAVGLAVQGRILSSLQPTGLWLVATALVPLHLGAAGGVLLELLRTTSWRRWPGRCAFGQPTRVGSVSVLLAAPCILGSVSLVHWAGAALWRVSALETPEPTLFSALAGVDAGSTAGAAVALLVWVPLVEEVLFRFLLTDGLAQGGARHPGALSAALFALAHGVPAHVPGLWLLGVILQDLRRRHGGLWAPILAHGLYNALALTWWLVLAPSA